MPETRPFSVQNYLTPPEDRAAYLDAILEDGDATLVAAGLGEIARAIGVSEFSRQTGISREAIYKGLAPGGNPTLETLIKVTKALGLRLTVAPASGAAAWGSTGHCGASQVAITSSLTANSSASGVAGAASSSKNRAMSYRAAL